MKTPSSSSLAAALVLAAAAAGEASWTRSSVANPLPKNAVMISNATMNPVAVYECAVNLGADDDDDAASNYVSGALAYEQTAWRCMYYDPTAQGNLSSAGPGKYEVYTDTFNSTHEAQATPEKPFPTGAIQPLFTKYKYATGCQTVYTEIIGGFAYYFPAYGTALPNADGSFVCYGATFRLHPAGAFVPGGLPYNVAVDTSSATRGGGVRGAK